MVRNKLNRGFYQLKRPCWFTSATPPIVNNDSAVFHQAIKLEVVRTVNRLVSYEVTRNDVNVNRDDVYRNFPVYVWQVECFELFNIKNT